MPSTLLAAAASVVPDPALEPYRCRIPTDTRLVRAGPVRHTAVPLIRR